MSTKNPLGPITHELLVLGKSGGDKPNYVYVSILEGSVRVFGKQLLKNLFSSDSHLSREHFQIEFANGRVILTNLSKSNDTIAKFPDSAEHTLRQGTLDSIEIPVKAVIKAGTSLFRLEEIIPCQLSAAPSTLEPQFLTSDEPRHEEISSSNEPIAVGEPPKHDPVTVPQEADLHEVTPTRDSTQSSGIESRDSTDSFAAVQQLVADDESSSLGFDPDDFFADEGLR